MMPSAEPGRPVILVTDDELFILQYVRQVLQLADFTVITTTTADQAWAILKRRLAEIDLVLTDIVMPGSIDGLELAARLRQLDHNLPVLFMTGALPEDDPRTGSVIEKQALLRKPFFPKQLVDFIGTRIRSRPDGLASEASPGISR
jgi:DNA-binding response OmpR family regulator